LFLHFSVVAPSVCIFDCIPSLSASLIRSTPHAHHCSTRGQRAKQGGPAVNRMTTIDQLYRVEHWKYMAEGNANVVLQYIGPDLRFVSVMLHALFLLSTLCPPCQRSAATQGAQ
jgi:hypothetical protein